MNIPGVPDVLAHILREDEDDIDLKDFATPSEDSPGWWEQVGGDFGNPWEYGGEWHNPVTHKVLYFGGVESDPGKEVDYADVKVPEHVMANIIKRYHDPATDAEEDADHKKWLLNREQFKIDQVVDAYKIGRADFLNNRVKLDFWLFDASEKDYVPPHLQRYVEPVRQQFDKDADFDNWPIWQKLLEIGRYAGFEDFAEHIQMNKLEAQAFLGTGSRKLKL